MSVVVRMLLRYFVYTLILAKLGCFGTQWQALEDLKLTLRKYSRTGDDVIRSIDDFMVKKRHECLDFLQNIDSTPFLERSELRPYCSKVHQRLEQLIYSFKTDIAKMETPLINTKLEIKDRLSDVLSSIDIYQKLADNKHVNCRPGDYQCLDGIVHWLNDKANKLHCRVTANCWKVKNNTRVERSVSDCEEFQCKNGECISYEDVCNGFENCTDGSDETPDCKRYCFNGFHCRDLGCIEKAKICDGSSDCKDGSDEEGCQTLEDLKEAVECSVENGKFLCSNEKCVDLAVTCDGKDDCGDDSDEGPKCRSETRCSGGCTASGGVCLIGPKGPLCLEMCPNGMADQGGRCRPGPYRTPGDLDELFEQVPYFLERNVGAVGLMKRRLISGLEKALLSCLEPPNNLRSYVKTSK